MAGLLEGGGNHVNRNFRVATDKEPAGSLIINSDGSYFAEFDLLVMHPKKPR